MPPKKRDREIEESKDTNFEQIQADHELFLQAFEKPTQIYRFLRTRNVIAPIFMHRTLTYMRHRMSRTHKNRKKFKVDQLLEKVVTQRQKDGQTESMKSGFLNITLTGFYDKCSKGYGSNDAVSVEALLLKICHKKRKLVGSGVTMATTCAVFLQDMASPVMQIAIGKADVPRNPDVNCSSQHATAISVPSDNFNLSNGHSVKSYVLLLKVHCPFWRTMPNGVYNGEFSDSDEPPPKKRKNGKLNHNEEDAVLYGAELVVFDKYQRCMLTDGDYELVLQDLGTKVLSRKHTSWETISDGKIIGPFEVFNKGPTLKFTLTWSTMPQNGPVSMPLPNIAHNDQNFLNNNQISDHITEKNNAVVKKSASTCKPKKKMRIFYQFLYNNNTRQQTEARDDLHCPWCSLNCTQLYSLLKHLKLCHSRFIFTYVPHPKGARIDVSINECYDGSYSGNPQDVHSQTGYAFSRNGPVRRTPVTNAMVSRPKRLPPSLSEFLEADDTELEGSRPYITGHNRLYHHTKTCLPVRPQEIDNDSEAENDPEWLKTKTINMIDEFTDVNEGEKELMKLWNLHIMKHNFVGDCQIPRACEMFVTEHAKEMFEKNLCRNFILHMCSLYDFGLIAPNVIQRTVNLVRSLRSQSLPLQT